MSGRIAGVVGAVLLAVVAWSYWPTEERAVRARVTTLVEALSGEAGESDLQRIARAATLASALTPDVIVALDNDRQLHGRESVLGVARQWMQTRGDTQVSLDDLDVAVGAGGATANLVVRADDERHEVRLHLAKPDSTWLVQRAELVSALARPPVGR